MVSVDLVVQHHPLDFLQIPEFKLFIDICTELILYPLCCVSHQWLYFYLFS